MRTTGPAIVLLGLLLAVPLGALGDPYKIEDLDALARKQQWDELLAHSGDVPDPKRGPAWHDLVERAALGKLAATAGGDLAVFEVEEELQQRSYSLVQFAAFTRKHDALVARLKSSPATALKAARVASSHYQGDTAAGLYAVALAGKGAGAPECAEPGLGDSVERALGGTGSAATQAHGLAVQCYDKLAGLLRRHLGENGGEFDTAYFGNVCGLLKSHGNLSGLQSRECRK